MRTQILIVLGAILVSGMIMATRASVSVSASSSFLRRCENNYEDEELAEMQADGEDGYEPDDCPLLAHVLTGPMRFNFCQGGDEDWIKFKARPSLLYQIRADPLWNYPTEPHLELLDDGAVVAENDHYFNNNAEMWWSNGGGERWMYIRATELRGRHDCGNNEYTLSLHAFEQNPVPPPPTLTPTITASVAITSTETITATLSLTPTVTASTAITPTEMITPTPTITPKPGN
jgi:hypothetical protein